MEPGEDESKGIGSVHRGGRFCVHRWSIVKRFYEGKKLYCIMRCRWCNDWKRMSVGMSDTALTLRTDHYEKDVPQTGQINSKSDNPQNEDTDNRIFDKAG